jgi:two-component system sensor histidine kinase YesM
MRNCGTVIYLVNPEKLVSSFLTENNNMLIVDRDGAVIFSSLDTAQQEELIRHIPSLDNRYEIRKLENQTYFITSRSVSRLGWNYYNVADYDQLFSFIHKMDLLYSFVLLGILVVIGLLTAYISVGLLKPIVILSKRIEAIGNDEDPVRALNGQKPEKVTKREDEIGQLETAFSDMAQRLSDLIRENYEQKLYLQNAKLSALRSKLNPHFLYNTLDTIRWMATEEKYHKIPGIVKALGDILRISINSKENLIPVDQEMQYMRGYLMIQKARFGERLNVCMEVSEELLSARIPAFSIQPLLENAVNYALEKMEKPCRIQVSIRQENSDILCSVADNGDGMDPQILDKLKLGTVKAEGNGMGLTNLNERLKSLYGPEYGVQVEHSDMGGALISFRVKKEVEYKDGVTESNAGR